MKRLCVCVFAIFACSIAPACSQSTDTDPQTGSESHWLSCTSDQECPSDYSCQDGKCKLTSIPHTDANPSDAQPTDAGPSCSSGQGQCCSTAGWDATDLDAGHVWGDVAVPQGVTARQLGVGRGHMCALGVDGTIKCWNATGLTDVPSGTFTKLSSGDYHDCAIRDDKSVVCWGMGSDPNANESTDRDYDQSVTPAGQFTDVAAGGYHTCAIKTDGTVQCWGRDDFGQATPPSGTFTQVSAGALHTCGIRTDGTLACWGAGSTTSASGPENFAQSQPPSGTFKSVSAGWRHTCAVRSDGTPECWGLGSHRQCDENPPHHGDDAGGIEPDQDQAAPPNHNFAQISSGQHTSCGVDPDGAIACWGWSAPGWPDAHDFIQVQTNWLNCAIRTDHSVYCWRWAPSL